MLWTQALHLEGREQLGKQEHSSLISETLDVSVGLKGTRGKVSGDQTASAPVRGLFKGINGAMVVVAPLLCSRTSHMQRSPQIHFGVLRSDLENYEFLGSPFFFFLTRVATEA